MAEELPDGSDGRHSNFRLEISIAIGYQRKRTTMAGKLEGGLVTFALLLAGIATTLLILWRLSLITF
jgi:hypothetical protein